MGYQTDKYNMFLLSIGVLFIRLFILVACLMFCCLLNYIMSSWFFFSEILNCHSPRISDIQYMRDVKIRLALIKILSIYSIIHWFLYQIFSINHLFGSLFSSKLINVEVRFILSKVLVLFSCNE